jgi:hypothetical protein
MIERDTFLAEMQRITAENKGMPPGIQRFRKEAQGVQGDWRRFWPKWSEFVKDAGFVPNGFGQRFEDPNLLNLFALLARELGRSLPTRIC